MTARRSDGSRASEDRNVDKPIPWLTGKEMRDRLKAEAREERGRSDLGHCAHQLNDGCECGKVLRARVVDERDGEVLVEGAPGAPLWKMNRAGFAALAAKRAEQSGRRARAARSARDHARHDRAAERPRVPD